VLIVAVVDDVLPPLKSLSANQLPTAPPPELICSVAVWLTVSDTDAVCVTLPLVPVIVSGWVPLAVVLVVLTVNVEVPEPVIVLGLKPDVAPVGSPLKLSVTTPPNPFSEPTVTV
jgi:hypothetical protein